LLPREGGPSAPARQANVRELARGVGLSGTEEVLGCLYIYPAKDGGGDAEVRSWVRGDVAELDGPLRAAVSRWLVERWPFERVVYADRPART
jgi:hypothetical protein